MSIVFWNELIVSTFSSHLNFWHIQITSGSLTLSWSEDAGLTSTWFIIFVEAYSTLFNPNRRYTVNQVF